MDVKQINSVIMFGTLSDVELNSIVDAIKFRRASMQRQARYTLRVGSAVTWHSPKQGMRVKGTVEKIATKYVTVRNTAGMMWKVPMNMLEAA